MKWATTSTGADTEGIHRFLYGEHGPVMGCEVGKRVRFRAFGFGCRRFDSDPIGTMIIFNTSTQVSLNTVTSPPATQMMLNMGRTDYGCQGGGMWHVLSPTYPALMASTRRTHLGNLSTDSNPIHEQFCTSPSPATGVHKVCIPCSVAYKWQQV